MVSISRFLPLLRPLEAKVSFARTLGPRRSVRRWRAEQNLRRHTHRRLRTFTRTMWEGAAREIEAEFRELSPGLFRIERNGVAAQVLGQRTPFADPVSTEVASDKALARKLMAEAGVRVPESEVFAPRALSAARTFLESGTESCVVKPRRGSAGGGVTGSVTNADQLGRALRRAAGVTDEVLVERQVAGDHYRVLLLDGDVLDVIRRQHPRVTGDGASTIEQLMAAEHQRRLASEGLDGMKPFQVDLDCLFTLAADGYGLDTVLPAGTVARVKTATNISSSRECTTFTGPVAPEFIGHARAAAAAVGVRLAGVDVLTTDPSLPLAESGGVVLEVNPTPGLWHHYNVTPAEQATRVAVPVLEALLARAPQAGPAS
jgi:D-alanine-D-alanine ligase-like ATP-grasp enzyme